MKCDYRKNALSRSRSDVYWSAVLNNHKLKQFQSIAGLLWGIVTLIMDSLYCLFIFFIVMLVFLAVVVIIFNILYILLLIRDIVLYAFIHTVYRRPATEELINKNTKNISSYS